MSELSNCSFHIGGTSYGRFFEFDLETLQRNYFIENPDVDLCKFEGIRYSWQRAEGQILGKRTDVEKVQVLLGAA